MPNTDYSQSGRIAQQRNRTLFSFYRANPKADIPEWSSDILRQVVTGGIPIFTTRIGGRRTLEAPAPVAPAPVAPAPVAPAPVAPAPVAPAPVAPAPTPAPTPAPVPALAPPTLVYGLPADNSAYIYFTPGTIGTPVNYEYTTDGGNTATALTPSDILSPVYIPNLLNGVTINIQMRGVNASNAKSIWSNAVQVMPSNPVIPSAQLEYNPNIPASITSTTVKNNGAGGTMDGTLQSVSTTSVATFNGNPSRTVFNFTGSGYISFGAYDFGDAFTISAWVYPRTKFSINGLLANSAAHPALAGFKVGWNNWQSEDKRMTLEAGNSTSRDTQSSAANTVTLTEWQYLSYVFNKSDRRIIFYRNGIPVNTSTISTVANITTSNGPFLIGAYVGPSYNMNAQLGLIKVFNTDMNAAQILADYNATKSAFVAT